MSIDKILKKLETMNGDGCNSIIYLKNGTTGDIYFGKEYGDDEEYEEY